MDSIAKIKVDKIPYDGLPCAYLLNTGMYGTAPDSIAVFLRPASKGMLGWAENILNICRSLTYAVFNIPALVLNFLEQEYVMKKPTRNPSEIPEMWRNHAKNVDDILYDIGVKITFITESAPLMLKNHSFSEAGISGLWFMLNHVMDDVLKANSLLAEIRDNGGAA